MYYLLNNGSLDLGIIILPEQCDSLNTIPITEDQIVLCVARYHRLSQARTVRFSELENEQFILLKEDSYIRQAVLCECQNADFTPKVIFSSNQYKTIEGLVANGIGISFLISKIAMSSANFVSIPMAKPLNITIGLAWPKSKMVSRAAEAFISFVKCYSKEDQFINSLN